MLIFVRLFDDLILDFDAAIWHEKAVDSNSHRLSPLCYNRINQPSVLVTPEGVIWKNDLKECYIKATYLHSSMLPQLCSKLIEKKLDLDFLVIVIDIFSCHSNESFTPLRERCSNTEFFLVRIFPYSLCWGLFLITLQPFRLAALLKKDSITVNAGKYGPEKTPYLNTFSAHA